MPVNIYETTFEIECPNDGECISYKLHIQYPSDKMIMVEEINEGLTAIESIPSLYHEEIADKLIAGLGGIQTITAVHQGVNVTTLRGQFSDTEKLALSIKRAVGRYGFSNWVGIAEQVSDDMRRVGGK